MTLLEVKDLSVAYGEIEALRGVSFTIEEGAVVALLGSNGAGKSTTLRAISGLVAPRAGSILFDGKTIAGYYTLSQYGIEAGELPPELVQQLHLPKYDRLPATLLGRLARSKEFKGRGLGELLLMGAMKRALEHSRNIASVAVVVDAIDENARGFYRRYGFIDIPNHPNRLFISMKTVAQLFPDVD